MSPAATSSARARRNSLPEQVGSAPVLASEQ